MRLGGGAASGLLFQCANKGEENVFLFGQMPQQLLAQGLKAAGYFGQHGTVPLGMGLAYLVQELLKMGESAVQVGMVRIHNVATQFAGENGAPVFLWCAQGQGAFQSLVQLLHNIFHRVGDGKCGIPQGLLPAAAGIYAHGL